MMRTRAGRGGGGCWKATAAAFLSCGRYGARVTVERFCVLLARPKYFGGVCTCCVRFSVVSIADSFESYRASVRVPPFRRQRRTTVRAVAHTYGGCATRDAVLEYGSMTPPVAYVGIINRPFGT